MTLSVFSGGTSRPRSPTPHIFRTIAPMDFAVFQCIKADLFYSQELERATMHVVRNLDSRWCHLVFNKCAYRHEKCFTMNGVYSENKLIHGPAER